MIEDVLAVHRITHFVTRDRLARPIRALVIANAYDPKGQSTPHEASMDRLGWAPPWDDNMGHDARWDSLPAEDPDPPLKAVLIGCPWCVSPWIALGVYLARRWIPGWRHAARVLAIADVAAIIETRLGP